jgi:DNA-binding beta-propeller fold protein YncE
VPARSTPIVVGLLALALIGCGASTHRRRAGAEPAVSPPPASRPVGRLIGVGVHPEGIAVDPVTGLVAVATREPPALVLLDARSGQITARIRLPGVARHLALSSDPPTVLVPSEPLDRLFEVALPGGRLSSIRVGMGPHDAAVARGRIFVGDELGHSVSVVKQGRLLGTIGGFIQPGGVTTTARLVAVIDVGADTLTLINPFTLRTIGTAAAGSGATHGVGDASGHVYVTDTRGDAVLDFATRPRPRLLARTALPGTPYGIAIDPSRDRLWVTLTATNRLVELAIGGPAPMVLRSYPTGRQPNTVAVDPRTGRVFVACAADGAIDVIDPH